MHDRQQMELGYFDHVRDLLVSDPRVTSHEVASQANAHLIANTLRGSWSVHVVLLVDGQSGDKKVAELIALHESASGSSIEWDDDLYRVDTKSQLIQIVDLHLYPYNIEYDQQDSFVELWTSHCREITKLTPARMVGGGVVSTTDNTGPCSLYKSTDHLNRVVALRLVLVGTEGTRQRSHFDNY